MQKNNLLVKLVDEVPESLVQMGYEATDVYSRGNYCG
jgi:hypothetical protein